MKHFYRTYILAVVFSATACTSTRLLTSNVPPSKVRDIQKFETISCISLMETGEYEKRNDQMSVESKFLFDDILLSFHKLPVTGEISAAGDLNKQRLEKEIQYLVFSADREQKISHLRITPTINSLLQMAGKRFGLITVTAIDERAEGNYGTDIAMYAPLGTLPVGKFYQTPLKTYSTVYAMIVDAESNNVAFFRKSSLRVKKARLDKAVLSKHVNALFSGYF